MDVSEDDDLGSPSEKRARLDDQDDNSGGKGRSGRMRKKSAKVLEMEEFEETERKQATQGKTKGSAVKKKPLKSGAPPPVPIAAALEAPTLPLTVASASLEDSNEEIVVESPFKMKLPFTPTGMAAGPPVNLPPPPPSSKSLTKKPPVKPKKEKLQQPPPPVQMSPPLATPLASPPGLSSMLGGSPTKEKNLFDTFSLGSGIGGDDVSALQMALQADLSPPPPSSAEQAAKKLSDSEKSPSGLSSPTHAPHLAAALLQAPISSSSLMLSAAASPSAAILSHGEDSSDMESDGPLVIDTIRPGATKKKVKKDKEKKLAKVKVEQVMQPSIVEEMDIDRVPGDETSASSAGSEVGDLDDAPVYSNTDKMALKLMTSSEKKASKKKTKKAKKEDPDKPKKKRAPTAYMLWCNSYRGKVVADNPGIDFAQISKRLGEIWQGLAEKDKMMWKRKAKKAAGKGSTLISTGKAGTKGAAVTAKPPPAPAAKPEPKSSGSKAAAKSVSIEDVLASSKHTGATGTGAVDVAAHLKLLGESLTIIGSRLQEHQGQIAVQGSLSVLLDSLLCALGPLMCLTQMVKELNGIPPEVLTKTLDSIAYFMPGIG